MSNNTSGGGLINAPRLGVIVAVLAIVIGVIFATMPRDKATGFYCTIFSCSSSLSRLTGQWAGRAKNGNNVEFDVIFDIPADCTLGQPCGTFNLITLGCSGSIRFISVKDNTYQFEAFNKSSICDVPAIYDGLELLKDGTILYRSRGENYGESQGTLQRVS